MKNVASIERYPSDQILENQRGIKMIQEIIRELCFDFQNNRMQLTSRDSSLRHSTLNAALEKLCPVLTAQALCLF